jgi:hypothetical protein
MEKKVGMTLQKALQYDEIFQDFIKDRNIYNKHEKSKPILAGQS